MGLDVPNLDERTYEETLEEAKKLIPAYAEAWTDFNPHDPGITILEVLSWLVETHSYQLDQVTDEHRRKYLQLMGTAPRPPQPATTQVSLSRPETSERIPAGTTLTATDGTDDSVAFETVRDVVQTPARIERVLTDTATGVVDNTHENETDGMYYRAFGLDVEPDDALYLGFDRNPFAESDALTLWVAYYDENLPEPTPEDGSQTVFEPSVDLVWESYRPDEQQWEPLAVEDGTTALYDSGQVSLEQPNTNAASQHQDSPEAWLTGDCWWIRCRVQTPGYEVPPQLQAIETNVLPVRQQLSVENERLKQQQSKTATALDGQTYEFEHAPVQQATVSVDGQRWREVPDFDAVGPDATVYVLNRERGTVTFGDGTNGATPPADARVVAEYEYGGGEAGNVSATATWGFEERSDRQVTPKAAASGGADAETIEQALRRVRRDRKRAHRAVTVEDFQAIAERTPGIRIGRTNVVPSESGVTVVVVPFAPADVACPRASDGFLDAVRAFVAERKLLTDTVEVVAPRYVGLDVSVTATARPGYAAQGYESAVTTAISEYVHPLVGYDGEGWPFGRALSSDELRAEVTALDAIDDVAGLTVTAHGGAAADGGVVRIDETALFYVENIETTLRRPAAEEVRH